MWINNYDSRYMEYNDKTLICLNKLHRPTVESRQMTSLLEKVNINGLLDLKELHGSNS